MTRSFRARAARPPPRNGSNLPRASMEAAVRCLRDAVAPDETACCLVLVADDARVDGEEGMETFSSLLREHADAAAAGRARAAHGPGRGRARARRHRLEARARPEFRGAHSRDGDALAVVDLTRDPHGWLVSIGAEPSRDGSVHGRRRRRGCRRANETATRDRTAPRLGDVASVAAAVHDALGGDAARNTMRGTTPRGTTTNQLARRRRARRVGVKKTPTRNRAGGGPVYGAARLAARSASSRSTASPSSCTPPE